MECDKIIAELEENSLNIAKSKTENVEEISDTDDKISKSVESIAKDDQQKKPEVDRWISFTTQKVLFKVEQLKLDKGESVEQCFVEYEEVPELDKWVKNQRKEVREALKKCSGCGRTLSEYDWRHTQYCLN